MVKKSTGKEKKPQSSSKSSPNTTSNKLTPKKKLQTKSNDNKKTTEKVYKTKGYSHANYLKSGKYVKKGRQTAAIKDPIASDYDMDIKKINLTKDEILKVDDPEDVLYTSDKEKLVRIESSLSKFLTENGMLACYRRLRNLTFPKSDPPLTWTCYCDKNFTTGAGIWYHMKKATCCARGYICLLDLQKFETIHEIEDHLALNYNYTRPNKIELLEKKIKGEFLEEALEIGKSGRRRKKVDYNKDIDISGGKDEEGDDEEMNKKMKKIKLQEDSILSDDSDGSFDKKMRKELASQSAEDDDDEDSDEDSENSIASDIPTPEESEILDQNDINDIMADITSSTPKKNSRIKTEFNSSSNLSQKNNKRKTPKKEFAYTPQPSATGPNQKATDFKNLHRETILDHKNLAAHINQTCTIPTNLWKIPENKKFLNSSFPDKEFKLQKKLSEDEKNISSWPFVFNQENEQIYEINGVIEQTSNRFSFFAGHEAIQTLFIEEFLLVVSVTYIDFFEPKKAKKENQSQGNLTYNFIGRLHFDLSRINQLITEENGPSKEATVCKVPQFYHPEFSTTKNLIFAGYINSEVDIFQIDIINRKFSLLHTIRNDMVEISCFNHNLGQVDAMDISSSNEYLAISYSISSSIFIYRILDFEVMAIIEEHEKNIKCLSFCPWNDHLIVSGSYDRKLYYHNWMDSPDFPIEFLNQNYQSAVFTSSVWPLMCPGLIVTTENAFAGDKMYGTHLYWIDNGNFEPPSGRPSIIFGPRQTMWKCDYSGFLNCLVVVDEAGCCYLSALPNFRRRWSVLKAISKCKLFSMKAQKVHIESTPDQKQADDLQEKTLKTLHPDVRLAEEEKLKHRKKLRNLGAKIYFRDDVNNTKNSMMKGSVNSGALNNACDFEMVSMEERLQLPLRSHGLIDVQFCKNEEYRSRLVVLGKNGVVRVVELPIS